MSSHNLSNENGLLFNPDAGTTYKYEIDETKEIEQAIGSGENKVKLTANSKIGLLYKILKKAGANYEVLVQFDHCIMDNYTGEDAESDFAEKNSASHQKNIEAFKDAIFSFDLWADGRVENINGFKEFKGKFNSLSDSSFNEEYFRDIFEKISSVLPGKTVFVNSSWLHKDSLEIGESQSLNAQYTFDSIYAGTAYIKTTSPVEQTITALNHSVKMQGKEDGVIEIDAKTGMLITRSQKSIITGGLKIGEVYVSMNINRSSIITGKKI